MTFIDYLVDSILILIVVRQVVESRFDKRAKGFAIEMPARLVEMAAQELPGKLPSNDH